MPGSELVTKWAAEWADSVDPAMVRKAFDVCGLVPRNEFDVEKLHGPLRDVYKRDVTVKDWITAHGNAVEARVLMNMEHVSYEGKNSFSRAAFDVMKPSNEYVAWQKRFIDRIISVLREDEATKPVFTNEELLIIKEGKNMTDTFLEFYALSLILKNFDTFISYESTITRAALLWIPRCTIRTMFGWTPTS